MAAKVRQGGARTFTEEILDQNGNLVDPAALTITLLDKDGIVVVNAAAMTRLSTGVWAYPYQFSSTAKLGQWRKFFTITDTAGFTDITEPVPAVEVTA